MLLRCGHFQIERGVSAVALRSFLRRLFDRIYIKVMVDCIYINVMDDCFYINVTGIAYFYIKVINDRFCIKVMDCLVLLDNIRVTCEDRYSGG